MERIMSLKVFSHSCSALWAEFCRGGGAWTHTIRLDGVTLVPPGAVIAEECGSPALICLTPGARPHRTHLQRVHGLFQLLHLLESVVDLLLDLGLRGPQPLLSGGIFKSHLCESCL